MDVPRWKYHASIYTKRDHCTLYRDDTLGVQMQVMVKREWLLMKPRERVYYFIDGVRRAYRAEEEMLGALKFRRPVVRQRMEVPVWELVSGKMGA